MTEAEWLACVEPPPMLWYLQRGGASGRKLRLFAQACWQRLSHLVADQRLRDYMLVLERHADGLVGRTELAAARVSARAAHRQFERSSGRLLARQVEVSRRLVKWGGHRSPEIAARQASQAACAAAWAGEWALAAEEKAQCDLLREIFGNPFRPPAVAPSWAAWNDSLVVKLAGAIYEERAFDRLPVLADALEEAGCTGPDILTHCRDGGQHALGCWVVDSLLGRA